jgi:hypothetical protein
MIERVLGAACSFATTVVRISGALEDGGVSCLDTMDRKADAASMPMPEETCRAFDISLSRAESTRSRGGTLRWPTAVETDGTRMNRTAATRGSSKPRRTRRCEARVRRVPGMPLGASGERWTSSGFATGIPRRRETRSGARFPGEGPQAIFPFDVRDGCNQLEALLDRARRALEDEAT